MNRREILKFTLLAPLVGLFKKKSEKKPPLMYCDAEGNTGIVSETSGTSGGVVAYRVSWEDKKMHVEKVPSEAFYEESLFNDYNLI